jgi:hypothetical protein
MNNSNDQDEDMVKFSKKSKDKMDKGLMKRK